MHFSNEGKKNGIRRSSSGMTMVELLVTVAVVSVVACVGGLGYLRSSKLEKNFRREAYARTTLVKNLERLEQLVSLATSVEWIGKNGEPVDSGSLPAAESSFLKLDFPLETGGISLETNWIPGVVSIRMRLKPREAELFVSNIVDGVGRETMLRMPFESPMSLEREKPVYSPIRAVVTNVSDSLVHVTLSSSYVRENAKGDADPVVVSADRLVRLWNARRPGE